MPGYPSVPRPQERKQHHEEIDGKQLIVEKPDDPFWRDDRDDHDERIEAPSRSDQHRRDHETRCGDSKRPDRIGDQDDDSNGKNGEAYRGDPSPSRALLQHYRF